MGVADFVIEAGDEDVAVLILEFGDDLREGDEGIGRGAAVHAGVKVGARATGFDFGVDHAAQADAERGQVGREHFGVGDQRNVGLSWSGCSRTKAAIPSPPTSSSPSMRTRTLTGSLPALAASSDFEGFDVHPDLAFVVDSAARVEIAVALRWLEGRRSPFVQRVGRLDVVVAVEQDSRRGLPSGVQPVGVDERMAAGVR